MNKIKMLDEPTIQKIAAGEIIERPASVIKELVENSLDANSTSIIVEISNGGKDYIRVTDNGDGLSLEDLNIAFKRHSTSKINNAEDLFNIMSFGFRGEALASISAISKVEVLTKTSENISGIQAFIEEGKIIENKPVGCPKGTTMIVRDLFYNIPVRKGFLKNNTVESNHIDEILYKLALGNNNVSFKYIRDNKVIFNTSKNNNLITNIYTLLGKDFSNNLIEINCESKDYSMYGYISNNSFYRGNRKHQYLYVNNRYVKNKDISNLIEEKYKSLIPINKFPVFIVFIDIDPSLIDVNIHPTKQEIKFINHQEIQDSIDKNISDSLYNTLYIQKVRIKQEEPKRKSKDLPLIFDKEIINDKQVNNKNEKRINNYKDNYEYNSQNNFVKEKLNQDDFVDENFILADKEDNKKQSDFLEDIRIIGVLFSTYILLESIESKKLFIMDQHAAHERVLYEKFKEEFESENIVIQNLLAPEVLELSNMETEYVIDNINTFKKLGFIVEEFGQNSVIIRGVPLLFGKPQMKSFFLELVDVLKSNIKSGYEVKLDKIMKIACTKAVKGGDRITNIEIKNLIEQLKKVKNPYTCPHGRPTIIEISKKDIEKEFKRIM